MRGARARRSPRARSRRLRARGLRLPSLFPRRLPLLAGLLGLALGAAAPRPATAQLRWLAEALAERTPRCLYYVETEAPAVALTLDDGPDPATTPAILDLLAEHDARATFFVVTDRIEGNEALLARLVAEGHELGNHHVREAPADDLPPERFARELRRAHRALARFAPRLRWYRPPSARFDEPMLDVLEEEGYRCALGSVYPFDAQIPSSWFAARVVLWAVQPGSVIVLHEGGERGERTAATLEAVLPVLARRGLRVVPLSRLAALAGPGVRARSPEGPGAATERLAPATGALPSDTGPDAASAILGPAHREQAP